MTLTLYRPDPISSRNASTWTPRSTLCYRFFRSPCSSRCPSGKPLRAVATNQNRAITSINWIYSRFNRTAVKILQISAPGLGQCLRLCGRPRKLNEPAPSARSGRYTVARLTHFVRLPCSRCSASFCLELVAARDKECPLPYQGVENPGNVLIPIYR